MSNNAGDRSGVGAAPGPLREVPVDWEALEDAFENNAPEVHSYLHLSTGEVLRVVDGVADPQMHVRIASETYKIDPVTKKSFKNICGRNGTSIAAPEVAGFFAQENAYLLTLGNNCGPSHDAPCAPLGRAGPILFAAPKQPHGPFYDITTGNTSNGLSAGFKAVPGYDLATGLGSANMMQLAWAINYNLLSAGSTPPIVAYSGAQPGTLYPGAVTVNFAINAANRGVAGYSSSNFSDPGDPASERTPKTRSTFRFQSPSSGPCWLGLPRSATRTGCCPGQHVSGCEWPSPRG